ncbi:MAG: outer membrane protein Omp31 [Xanthobacteraceae bacterium]|jgi:outer membrane immunogenic protein|nr:outer membrane protein Omp31 [Xanthobacteraceae bacterium]
MRRVLLASIGLTALLIGSASAADLPRQNQMVTKAPVYAPAPIYNWTGLYVGINGGYGFSDASGGLVGGTLGYNWQNGNLVFGVEGDLDWTNLKHDNAFSTTSNSWLGTARARVGVAMDRFMPYVTAGAAVGNIDITAPGFAGNNTTKLGWTAGAGLEFALGGNWTAKAEYLYVDLGSADCGAGCPVGTDTSLTSNIVRAGLNYRF